MAQRYVKNALARARARKERDTSEPEEDEEGKDGGGIEKPRRISELQVSGV